MRVGIASRVRLGPERGSEASQINSVAEFTTRTGLTPTLLFTQQEASGNVVDKVSSTTLTVGGSPSYQKSVGGTNGIHYGAGASHSANVGDVALNSFIFGAIATMGTPSVGLPGIGGRTSSTTFPSYMIYRANNTLNYPTFLLKDAGTSVTIPAVGIDVVNTGEPVLYMGMLDRVAAQARFCVATPDSVLWYTSQAASLLTLTGGTTPLFGMGAIPFLVGGGNISCSFLVTGAQVEGKSLSTIAKQLGFGGN